jgi:hypothetical protein
LDTIDKLFEKVMNYKPSFSSIVIRLALLAILFTSAQTVSAHGQDQTLELSHVTVGPYYLSVWSSPSILRAGEIHFAAAVTNEQGLPVPDCDVSLQIVSLMQEEKPITLIAHQTTGDLTNRQETQLNLLATGSYRVIVTVMDSAGLGNEASFDIEITAVPLSLEILLYASISFTVVVVLGLLKQGLVLFKLWQPTAVKRRPIR